MDLEVFVQEARLGNRDMADARAVKSAAGWATQGIQRAYRADSSGSSGAVGAAQNHLFYGGRAQPARPHYSSCLRRYW